MQEIEEPVIGDVQGHAHLHLPALLLPGLVAALRLDQAAGVRRDELDQELLKLGLG